MSEVIERKTSRAAGLLRRVQGDKVIVPIPPSMEAQVPPEPPKMTPPPVIETDYAFEEASPLPPAPAAAVEKPVEEPKKVIPKEYLPEDPTDEIDQLIDPKATTGENFKKLRTKLKSTNDEARRLREEHEAAKKKLQDYENGLNVPKVVEEQTERISKLEVYERLYNFQQSPVYEEKFAKPIRETQEKLAGIAKDYGVPLETLNKAFATENVAELDNILSQSFRNQIGALEVKGLIGKIKGIQREAQEAEKEPVQALARMQAENDAIIEDRRARANEVIKDTSRGAWNESLGLLREDARFEFLTFKDKPYICLPDVISFAIWVLGLARFLSYN
jgi:hypothetical protein